MSLPKIIEDIDTRVKDTGDTMTGKLTIKPGSAWSQITFGDNSLSSLHKIHGYSVDSASVAYLEANQDGTNNNRTLLYLKHNHNSNTPEIGMQSYLNGEQKAYTILNTGNYTNYVPTLTGTGASGTWPISITGNSATATKLATPRTIFGIGFDGSGNVVGKPQVYGSYTSTAANRYHQSGIEVRENGLVGNTQTDIGYAPSIGFHWSGKIAASLLFHNDGNFYLKKQDGTTRASLDANLIGNASTATKFATTRNIALGGDLTGSANFDGSGNITINGYEYNCSVSSGNKSNYPWHRIATIPALSNTYNDRECIILIRHAYDNGGIGLAKVSVRSNLNANGSAKIVWLYRYNINVDALQMGFINTAGNTQGDVYYKVGTWARCQVYQTQGGRSWTLVASNEVSDTTTSDKKTSYEVYTSIADGGSKLGKSYTHTIVAVDNSHPTSSGTSSMTANSSGLATSNVYLQYV